MSIEDQSAAPHVVFRLPSREVLGPLNIEKTMLSAQTSEPEWLRNGAHFVDTETFDGAPVNYSLVQTGSIEEFELEVHVSGNYPNSIFEKLRLHLNRVLGLRDDLPLFYRTFGDKNEPLSSTFSKLRGLRLMRGTNLYESLICSILSQNRSALLWNRTARLMMRYYGQRVDLPDQKTEFLFPKPEVIAAVSARELRSKTPIGYRGKPVVEVSRLITSGRLRLDDVKGCEYDEAREILMDLPGVGPKVADCFLLYGVGMPEAAPVDVWIHRIVTKLYFGNRKVSRLKAAQFLRERYGKWAGYAQLYLFDYARKSSVSERQATSKFMSRRAS
jgi:N-glycosylase/DNA lyase